MAPPGRRSAGGTPGGGGRTGGSARSASKTPRGRAVSGGGGLREEDRDELDRFHASANKLSLRLQDDAAAMPTGKDSGDELGVLDLGPASSDEEQEDDDAQLREMARARKAVKSRLLRQQSADEEEEEEEAGPGDGWGRRKEAYYDDGDEEDGDDEDAEAEEEREALRLQREAASGLRVEDFDQDELAEDAEEEEEDSESEGGAGAPLSLGALARSRGAVVESLTHRSAAAVAADAPELHSLALELRSALTELRERAAPLLAAARAGTGAPTALGISYLDTKHLLLLSYSINLTFYILLKAEGRPVHDHPVLLRLLEIRTFLDKAKPIDKRMSYQLDKLLRLADSLATGGAADGEQPDAPGLGAPDALSYRPNLGAMVSHGGDGGDGSGLYRAPKLAPVRMAGEEDGEERGAGRAGRAAAERRRRAARSVLVQELAEELDGAPTVLRGESTAAADSAFVRREAERLQRRAAEEESLFVRVPLSKQERKRSAAAERKVVGMSQQVADFADDVTDIVDAVQRIEAQGGGASGLGAPPAKRVKLSAIAAAAAVTAAGSQQQRARVTGEADVPFRYDLGERRAAFERRPAPIGGVHSREGEEEFGEDGDGGGAADMSDDEMYSAAAGAAASRKAAKRAAYDPVARFAPVHAAEAAQAAGKRGITGAMSSNRGLTPHRNKDMKNPRKKHRLQYAKALVRRSGAVREATAGAAGGYAGEATGIKTHVTKSRKL